MFLDFKKWVKGIQTAGYNGARTVIKNVGSAQKGFQPIAIVYLSKCI